VLLAQAAYEGLAGFGLGAGAGAITGREPSAEPVRPAPPTTPETPTPPAPPVSKYEGLSNDEVKNLVNRQVNEVRKDKTLTKDQKNEKIVALRLERDQLFEERKKVKAAPAATPTVTDTTTTETITDETLAGETDTETATTETITDETLAGETDTETATTETITDEHLRLILRPLRLITDETPADETTTLLRQLLIQKPNLYPCVASSLMMSRAKYLLRNTTT
jgi:hypothetical protein